MLNYVSNISHIADRATHISYTTGFLYPRMEYEVNTHMVFAIVMSVICADLDLWNDI